jgi:DNA invertase Pin-like site-specific DNA recombinase
LTEALDMTTPGGRALAGMLAVFAEFERDILRDRVKAGIAQARKEGRPHGRPRTVRHRAPEISALFAQGVSKRQIAARLSISRASVRRMLPARRGKSQGHRARPANVSKLGHPELVWVKVTASSRCEAYIHRVYCRF